MLAFLLGSVVGALVMYLFALRTINKLRSDINTLKINRLAK